MQATSKKLLESLLLKLDASRESILAIRDRDRRVYLLKEIFEKTSVEFGPHLVANLGSIYNFSIDSGGLEVDELIGEILAKIDSEFDDIAGERDKIEGFDARYGTQTEVAIEQFELPEMIPTGRLVNSTRYAASPITSVKQALDLLRPCGILCEEFVFIDVGCGLGRNLLLATRYPFKSIVGIEISPYLRDIAKENIAKYVAIEGARKVPEVVCQDALAFDFPGDNMVLYFWEPFSSGIGHHFVENLVRWAKKRHVRCVLIFLGRVFPAILDNSDFELVYTGYTRDVKTSDQLFELSLYRYPSSFPYTPNS
jgi:SAM-dependent methyltransferase